MKGAWTIAAELSVSERVLLFCVASGTEWTRAGLTGATATAMKVKGLIERSCADPPRRNAVCGEVAQAANAVIIAATLVANRRGGNLDDHS
jgi:hypothetical protein